jgi:hypothetical protein
MKEVISINRFNSRKRNIRLSKTTKAIYILSIILSCIVCYIAFRTTLTAKTYAPRKGIKMQWDKKNRSPIKIIDEEGNSVSHAKGKIWCVVLPENCPVAYN